MESVTVARIIHVLAVVIWIGGVSTVTMVIIPAVKRMKSKEEKIDTFEKIEGRFALIAKITTILTALSGFYILHIMNAWSHLCYTVFLENIAPENLQRHSGFCTGPTGSF